MKIRYFPHAWANVETRGESVFAARNAIDGIIYPTCHGRYPFESWGINRDPNACWMLDFGRLIQADTLVLTTRADFPHDAWWTQARLTLSNGEEQILPLQKTAEGQRFDLHGVWINCKTIPIKIYRPAMHPIHFAADSPDKIHRCAAWAVFFTNRTFCDRIILWNSFSVVCCITSKCYSCA